MSTDSPYTFDKLTHSGLAKFQAKENREVSATLGVFGGNAQFSVYTPGGGRPTSITLRGIAVSALKRMLEKMKESPRTCRQPVMIRDWNADDKKWEQIGQIGIGIDDTMTPFFDISHKAFQGQHVFLVRTDPKFDTSNTDLSEKETVEFLLDHLIDLLTVEVAIAKRLSTFKRPPNAGGGGGGRGNFGGNGGNGNRNYGGGGNSGGGNNYGGGSGGGGNTINDDLSL